MIPSPVLSRLRYREKLIWHQDSNGRIEVEAYKHHKLMLIDMSKFFNLCCYSSEVGDGEAGPREFSTLYSILLCRPTRHLRTVSRIQPDAQVSRESVVCSHRSKQTYSLIGTSVKSVSYKKD